MVTNRKVFKPLRRRFCMGNDENGRNNDDKKGLVSRAYDAVDDTIMYGVNKIVRGYNWTTGGTKAELANGFLTGATVALPVGILLINPILGCVTTGIVLPIIHYKQERNVEIEKKEVSALNRSSFDTDVEGYKERARASGEFNLGLSVINECGGLLIDSYPNILLGMGCGLGALDCYVMRAENLPPRRNCLKRGAEKLKDIVSSYSPKPAVVPVGV